MSRRIRIADGQRLRNAFAAPWATSREPLAVDACVRLSRDKGFDFGDIPGACRISFPPAAPGLASTGQGSKMSPGTP